MVVKKALLLRWLVRVYDIIEDQDSMRRLYSVYFYHLEYDVLR
jgi:hypothetical protein